jgi:hypothetical protein
MALFDVTYMATVSKTIRVEADDADLALEKADEVFESPTLCWQCGGAMDISDWEPDESEYGIFEVTA